MSLNYWTRLAYIALKFKREITENKAVKHTDTSDTHCSPRAAAAAAV